MKDFARVVTHVYYVLELKNNLLSLKQLQEKDLRLTIQNKCNVVHPEKGLIMEIQMSANRMFMLTTTMRAETTCLRAGVEDNSQLRDNKVGHLSYDDLETLVSMQMVTRCLHITTPQNLCAHCLAGKQHRNSMPKKSQWKASKKRLQLIRANLCRPIQPTSSRNKRHFLCFIDDLSVKTWVYFLSEKLKVSLS